MPLWLDLSRVVVILQVGGTWWCMRSVAKASNKQSGPVHSVGALRLPWSVYILLMIVQKGCLLLPYVSHRMASFMPIWT